MMCIWLGRPVAEVLIDAFDSKILTFSDEQGILRHPHIIFMVLCIWIFLLVNYIILFIKLRNHILKISKLVESTSCFGDFQLTDQVVVLLLLFHPLDRLSLFKNFVLEVSRVLLFLLVPLLQLSELVLSRG